MGRMMKFFIVLVLGAMAAGCTISSDEPLLDTSSAVQLLPRQTVAIGGTEGYALEWRGGAYAFSPDDQRFASAYFIPMPEIGPEVYVAQVARKAGDYTYGLLVERPQGFFRIGFSEEWVREVGVAYEEDPTGGIKVSSREALIAALSATYKQTGNKPDDELVGYTIYDFEDPVQRQAALDYFAELQAEQARQQEADDAPAATKAGNWVYREERDPFDDSLRQFVFGSPSSAVGTRDTPYIRVGCYDYGMGITLYWGTILTDLYPQGDVDMAGVEVRFDQGSATTYGWAVSEDWSATYPPTELGGAVAQLGNSFMNSLLPGLVGQVYSTWRPQEFHRRLLASQQVAMRSSTRGATAATLVFDMEGYDQVVKNFRSSCR